MELCLKIKYSWIYNKQFYLDLSIEEFNNKIWNRVLAIGKRFEKLYNKYIDRIVELIPKYSGFDWGECCETFIPIYLVKKPGPSFSDPLTLKVRSDLKLMLVILTHELCHKNMEGVIDDPLLRENVMNLTTKFVFKDLKLNVENQLEKLFQFTEQRFKKHYKPLSIDLSKTSVKQFLTSKGLLEND
ncbi:hypothetical protein J7L02_02020 [Candidatus Woesearchaeota archaeon]|nr:hypothetical protein [Candidatus Woesearchaeota archaeon]